MKEKIEIIKQIIELETKNDIEFDGYLDEGEQSELAILYWVLNEPLDTQTKKLIQKRREDGR